MGATEQARAIQLAVVTMVLLLSGCGALGGYGSPVMAVDVSDNGRYAISSHRDNQLVLWDLEAQSSEVLSEQANIYSAYFVPGKEAFLWQGLDDVVRVETVGGESLKQFEHFPTYGHVIDGDLRTYLSATSNWNLYAGYGDDLQPALRDSDSPSFTGTGKLLNIALSDSEFFVTAGRGAVDTDQRSIEKHPAVRPEDDLRFTSNYAGVVLWNPETVAPVAKLPGNSVKTHATISPDGQWVVSGDENGKGFFWHTDDPEERNRMARYRQGIYLEDTPYPAGDPRKRDDSELIEAPDGVRDRTLASAFIHESEYFLRFGAGSHIAALFKAGNPWPQKYFDLGESPELVNYGSQYSRNTAIATSPQAGVLVMGHRDSGGISVYEFDEEALALERVWVAR